MHARPKVVIIGAGFGGLNAAQHLKKADVDVLVIDKRNYHLFQPLLYQVATAMISPGNIASPIRHILSEQKNTTVIMADIVSIDKEKRLVHSSEGATYPFDYLIVATGSSHAYFGHPEWEKFAPALKTIEDAERIRSNILRSYEYAEKCQTCEEAKKYMCFVVVGGGPTGVEMAGAIGELAHRSLKHDFKFIDPVDTQIFLIEGVDQILPIFPRDLAEKAQSDLEKIGVKVRLKTLVTNVTEEGVFLGDEFIASKNVIWAAGNAASSLLKTLDVPLDKAGRVLVNPDLSIPGHPSIFVIGDAAYLLVEGNPLPGIAPTAIQQGRYVAKLISQPNKPRKPFKYFNKGMMATVGKAKAIAVVGKVKMSGFIAWLTWCFIHIFYLISFANRALVLLQWIFQFFSNKRRVRIINSPHNE